MYLCFDYGTRSIGVAIGNTITHNARPLTTIVNRDGQSHLIEIDQLVARWQPRALIVGLPFNMDGSNSAMTNISQKFADTLQQRFPIPVQMMDERLSSRAARETLGHGRTVQREHIDAHAAAIILTDWLQIQRKKP